MSKVLLVISATLAKVSQSGPRKDFVVLADRLGADVIDYESVEQSRSARLIKRVLGVAAAQAWLAFGRRNEADAILTDGEHIGIPLALMLKLTGARTAHVTIGHRITASKKRPFFRWLRVH